jgi:hypothetical protein
MLTICLLNIYKCIQTAYDLQIHLYKQYIQDLHLKRLLGKADKSTGIENPKWRQSLCKWWSRKGHPPTVEKHKETRISHCAKHTCNIDPFKVRCELNNIQHVNIKTGFRLVQLQCWQVQNQAKCQGGLTQTIHDSHRLLLVFLE